MFRLLRLDANNLHHRNAWNLCVEIFWASVLASAVTFNAAFAIRLGATNTHVGFLTAIPALMAVLVSIPAGRFLRSRSQRKPWLIWSLSIYRAGFIIVALIPWLPLKTIPAGALLVAVLVAISIPAHFFNVGFIPMLSEVIPVEMRASVFAARNILYNIVISAGALLLGLWLERIVFPINYQAMYLFGFACSMLSIVYLVKVQVPDSTPVRQSGWSAESSWKDRLQAVRRAFQDHPSFMHITLNTLLHGIGVWAATPLYVLYFLRELGAKEDWLGLNGTVAGLFTILGWTLWRWAVLRWGEPGILKRTIICVGLYPVVVCLLNSLPLILVATALNGLLIPGVNLSHFSTLLKVTPEQDRPGYTAIYMTIANLGIFICPIIGVVIANQFGLAPTLIGCGLLSIIGSFSFWLWPVQERDLTQVALQGSSGKA